MNLASERFEHDEVTRVRAEDGDVTSWNRLVVDHGRRGLDSFAVFTGRVRVEVYDQVSFPQVFSNGASEVIITNGTHGIKVLTQFLHH